MQHVVFIVARCNKLLSFQCYLWMFSSFFFSRLNSSLGSPSVARSLRMRRMIWLHGWESTHFSTINSRLSSSLRRRRTLKLMSCFSILGDMRSTSSSNISVHSEEVSVAIGILSVELLQQLLMLPIQWSLCQPLPHPDFPAQLLPTPSCASSTLLGLFFLFKLHYSHDSVSLEL